MKSKLAKAQGKFDELGLHFEYCNTLQKNTEISLYLSREQTEGQGCGRQSLIGWAEAGEAQLPGR